MSPVHIAYSTLKDGVMKFKSGASDEEVISNRQKFLEGEDTSLDRTLLCNLSYEQGIEYTRILEVSAADAGKGMSGEPALQPADAWFTKDSALGLFLPIADCGGVVVYDSKQKVLGMLHLGRHATFDGLAKKAIEHMKQKYGTDPKDIHIWISPSISGDSYWLHTFDKADDPLWKPFIQQKGDGWLVDLQGYNISRFIEAGVPAEQIEHSGINTATHPDFPSHYRHTTHGEEHKAGRFAVVAYIT